jgi:hypothetical protein
VWVMGCVKRKGGLDVSGETVVRSLEDDKEIMVMFT